MPSFLGILAIGLINEALDEGDTKKTLQALQIPAAKLEGVAPKVAQHYQDTLLRAKREKAQVSAIDVPHDKPWHLCNGLITGPESQESKLDVESGAFCIPSPDLIQAVCIFLY